MVERTARPVNACCIEGLKFECSLQVFQMQVGLGMSFVNESIIATMANSAPRDTTFPHKAYLRNEANFQHFFRALYFECSAMMRELECKTMNWLR